MTLATDVYYDYKKLATRWGVSVNTLRQWVMEGVLVPTMRLGRRVRFSLEYILEIEAGGGIRHGYR